MAFDWITFLLTIAIGIVGGLLSGIPTTLLGRVFLNRRLESELKKMEHVGKGKMCASCDRKVPVESAICTFCGKPVAGGKICNRCEISLPDIAVYCYRCQGPAAEKETSDIDQ